MSWVAPAIGAVYGAMLGVIREDANAAIAGAVLGGFGGFFVESIMTVPAVPAAPRPKPRVPVASPKPRPRPGAQAAPLPTTQRPAPPPPPAAGEEQDVASCIGEASAYLQDLHDIDIQLDDDPDEPNVVNIFPDLSFLHDRPEIVDDIETEMKKCGAVKVKVKDLEEDEIEPGQVPIYLRAEWPEGTFPEEEDE